MSKRPLRSHSFDVQFLFVDGGRGSKSRVLCRHVFFCFCLAVVATVLLDTERLSVEESQEERGIRIPSSLNSSSSSSSSSSFGSFIMVLGMDQWNVTPKVQLTDLSPELSNEILLGASSVAASQTSPEVQTVKEETNAVPVVNSGYDITPLNANNRKAKAAGGVGVRPKRLKGCPPGDKKEITRKKLRFSPPGKPEDAENVPPVDMPETAKSGSTGEALQVMQKPLLEERRYLEELNVSPTELFRRTPSIWTSPKGTPPKRSPPKRSPPKRSPSKGTT